MKARTVEERPLWESERSWFRMALAYVVFLVAGAFGIVLLLLSLFGSFFLGFALFALLVVGAFIGLPIWGVANAFRNRRARDQAAITAREYVTERQAIVQGDLLEAESRATTVWVEEEIARWNLADVLQDASPAGAVEGAPMETRIPVHDVSPRRAVPSAKGVAPRAMKAPSDAVVAVIDNAEEVDAASRDLVAAGSIPSDIRVFPPYPEGYEPAAATEAASHGFRHHVGRAFRFAMVEEEPMVDMYEEERRLGRSVVVVHVPGRTRADEVAGILAQHEAHSIKFFGRWQITDIAPARRRVAEAMPLLAENGPIPDIETIRDIDIFEGLADEDLEKVAPFCQVLDVPQGTLLARQGEIGRTIYLIDQGQVELTTDSPQGDLTVRIAGPGESFPLAALIGNEPLITNAIAMSNELRVVQISARGLAELCEREPQIGFRVFRTIAEILGGRYRATLTRLTGALDKSLSEMMRQEDIFANI